ncbi:MAG: carbohydrate-binding domain-containing protein [Eubacteriales bacterium]|nr:carbohydrate-binding domain-containing protein [Eubacteriales bacterium]
MKKTALAILLTAALAATLTLTSCQSGGNPKDESQIVSDHSSDEKSNASETVSEPESSHDDISADEHFTDYDKNESYSASDTSVTFNGNSVNAVGTGASVNGSVVTITKAGVYVISGSSDDGQIIVEVAKKEKVRLVFNGLSLTSASSAPVWIKSADKTVITLAEGTENRLTDASSYTVKTDDEPNSCLFSKDDLTINGAGTLVVTGKYNNGITSKDDLKIMSGTITVKAKNNALKGNDSVAVAGGTISIESSDDGIKTTNDSDTDKGYIYIRGGSITIISGDDALQATQSIIITGGVVTVDAGGKAVNCEGSVDIAEGCLVIK